MPDAKDLAAMTKYNQALKQAGVLIQCEGLRPPSEGARITFAGGKPKVTDGTSPSAQEVLGGYWLLDVKSKAEAVAWASRCEIQYNLPRFLGYGIRGI